MSAVDNNVTQGIGRAASHSNPNVFRVSRHDSQSDFLSSILELATLQISQSAAFFALPAPHHTWRVVASVSQTARCTIPLGATVRLGNRFSVLGSLIVDGAEWASASVSVGLGNEQGVDQGLLGVISPPDHAIPQEFVSKLTSLGRLLATQLELQKETNELRQSREQYRTIVDATAEGILLRRADGRIVAVNRTAEELLGVPADQLVGRVSLPFLSYVLEKTDRHLQRPIPRDCRPFAPERRSQTY